MLDSLTPFTGSFIALIVAILLLIFRGEVRKLVDWIISFKRIAKTKEGYALESSREPEAAPPATAETSDQVQAAVEAVPPAASRITPSDADTWPKAFNEKRYDAAIALLESDYENKSDPDGRLAVKSLMGYVRFEQAPAAGIAHFESLVRDFPTKYQPYHWWALTYLWKDLPEKCLAVLDRGLGAADKKAALLDTKSDCLARLGRVDEAIAAATKGVESDPTYIPNYKNLGELYEKKGDKESARAWYLKALDASGAARDVLEPYARFLSANSFGAEAVLRYRELVARTPDNATFWVLLGNAYLTAGLPSHALTAYLRGNELADGREAWILANIGNIYKNQGFYAEAIKYLKKAVECDSDSQYAHERLAQAQELELEEGRKLSSMIEEARRSLGGTLGSATPAA